MNDVKFDEADVEVGMIISVAHADTWTQGQTNSYGITVRATARDGVEYIYTADLANPNSTRFMDEANAFILEVRMLSSQCSKL